MVGKKLPLISLSYKTFFLYTHVRVRGSKFKMLICFLI
jgi:hypothetical protein